MPNVEIFPDAKELAEAAAARITARAVSAVRERGTFSLVLAGGTTPRAVYSLLATRRHNEFPWLQVHFFWGDERHVPPTNPDSNYRMAWDAMLSHVMVPVENVHRIHAEESDAELAAIEYSMDILNALGSRPVFDLVLLGLGPDGHTASLFPHTAALQEAERLVVANWVEKLKTNRITMTMPLLKKAREIVFLVQGGEKAQALHDVIEGAYTPEALPAQLIVQNAKNVVWMIDHDAATLLKQEPSPEP
jgi:6-phosphogluconolactonase